MDGSRNPEAFNLVFMKAVSMQNNNPPQRFSHLIEQVRDVFKEWGLVAFFVWVFLFAGIAVLGWGIMSTLEALATQSWPSTGGIIIASSVDSYVSSSDSGSTTMYFASIKYAYQVRGIEYKAGRVNLGDYSSSDTQMAEEVIARYPSGRNVRVYYDPTKPENAVLEPGLSAGLLIPLGIGVIFSLVGGGMSYFLFRLVLNGRFRSDSHS
jgi:hypothetical protein